MGKTGWSGFGSRKCGFFPDSGMGGRSTWKRRHQSVNGSSERSIFIDFFYPWHHGQLVVVMNKVALSTSYNICIGASWDRQDSINNVLMVLNPLNLPTPPHP